LRRRRRRSRLRAWLAKKKIWKSEAERDAWNAHVDESLAWARAVVERGLDELRKQGKPVLLDEIRAQKRGEAS
jgi:hypothetical protein